MPGDSLAPGRRSRDRRAAANERRFLQPSDPQKRPSANLERWRLIVRGVVQGVGYRNACKRRADELGLSGWVRNNCDGSVEVEIEGSQHELGELVFWCEKGTNDAQVREVSSTRVAITGTDWFEIRS